MWPGPLPRAWKYTLPARRRRCYWRWRLVLTLLYYALIPAAWIWKRRSSQALQELGPVRYAIVAVLFLTMLSLPIKMVMRIFFNIKYFWVTPWFNI